jgi:hypothetical protein
MSIKWMGISFKRKFREWKSREPGRKTEEKRRSIKAIGLGLLEDRDLVFELLQRGYPSIIRVLQSVSIREIKATFSTADPLWNGVLYGVFADTRSDRVSLSINF